jgi:hypothetical protein
MSKAVIYLKAAAENAAEAEDDALAAGLTKGGNLKGELTLAIFELGNCFRNGWVTTFSVTKLTSRELRKITKLHDNILKLLLISYAYPVYRRLTSRAIRKLP